ncbi:MAG: hypothetical protein GTN80_08055 [Nitrososphaeria archaeon]|nr:hypothetical protein [Nitrososphaeria archaeon]NIN53017.1 hypothetical protein [Nitrososphaeria archaeon]NIQ33576.1 hypothetical protein [Nitrososphaeria archaeon]
MVETEERTGSVIFIGKKPVSHYLASCFDLVNADHNRIWIEGMGQNITKVVDIVNYFRRFCTQGDVCIKDFEIDMVPKKVVHGLPKHVSRLRILLEVEKT